MYLSLPGAPVRSVSCSCFQFPPGDSEQAINKLWCIQAMGERKTTRDTHNSLCAFMYVKPRGRQNQSAATEIQDSGRLGTADQLDGGEGSVLCLDSMGAMRVFKFVKMYCALRCLKFDLTNRSLNLKILRKCCLKILAKQGNSAGSEDRLAGLPSFPTAPVAVTTDHKCALSPFWRREV